MVPILPIVSRNIRIRHPEYFELQEGAVVDDYSYFSTRVRVGRFAHIASCVTVGGGRGFLFSLGDFSTVSAGCRIWCASEDFRRDMAGVLPEGIDVGKNLVCGDVTIGDLSIVGSNSVIMPCNHIPEGVAIGAMSFVPADYPFDEWTVYAGVPIRARGGRDRDEVERQRAVLLDSLP